MLRGSHTDRNFLSVKVLLCRNLKVEQLKNLFDEWVEGRK